MLACPYDAKEIPCVDGKHQLVRGMGQTLCVQYGYTSLNKGSTLYIIDTSMMKQANQRMHHNDGSKCLRDRPGVVLLPVSLTYAEVSSERRNVLCL